MNQKALPAMTASALVSEEMSQKEGAILIQVLQVHSLPDHQMLLEHFSSNNLPFILGHKFLPMAGFYSKAAIPSPNST